MDIESAIAAAAAEKEEAEILRYERYEREAEWLSPRFDWAGAKGIVLNSAVLTPRMCRLLRERRPAEVAMRTVPRQTEPGFHLDFVKCLDLSDLTSFGTGSGLAVLEEALRLEKRNFDLLFGPNNGVDVLCTARSPLFRCFYDRFSSARKITFRHRLHDHGSNELFVVDRPLARLPVGCEAAEVVFESCGDVSYPDLWHLNRLPNLAQLSFRDVDEVVVSPRDTVYYDLPNAFRHLTRLSFRSCRRVSYAAFVAVVERAVALSHVEIYDCDWFNGRYLTLLRRRRANTVRELIIGSNAIGNADLRHLREFTALRFLDLTGSRRVTPAGVSHFRDAGPISSFTVSSGSSRAIERARGSRRRDGGMTRAQLFTAVADRQIESISTHPAPCSPGRDDAAAVTTAVAVSAADSIDGPARAASPVDLASSPDVTENVRRRRRRRRPIAIAPLPTLMSLPACRGREGRYRRHRRISSEERPAPDPVRGFPSIVASKPSRRKQVLIPRVMLVD